MCDLIRKLQSADNLRSSAGLSPCYRPYAEFLERHLEPNRAFQKPLYGADHPQSARGVANVLPTIELCGVGFGHLSRLTFPLRTFKFRSGKPGSSSAHCD